MQDDNHDYYVDLAPEGNSSSSSEEELQEISSNQETPIPTEVNSVTDDLSIQNLNDAFMWATFGTLTFRFPRRFVRPDGQTYSLIEADEAIAFYASDGAGEDLPVIEMASSDFIWDDEDDELRSSPVEESYRGSLSGCEGHPGQIMERLSLQAREMADELLAPSRSSDPPPPGRLPVSISSRPPEGGGIHLKIDLKKLTCVSNVQQRDDAEIPIKFRTENDRNKGLPVMDLSEESLRGWFEKACRHFEYFATRLKAMLLDINGEENLNSKDFDLAFKVFMEEFNSFDKMVSYALTRLRPKVARELWNQRMDMSVKFFKLHYACFSGKMCLQEDYLSRVSMHIQKIQEAIIETYT